MTNTLGHHADIGLKIGAKTHLPQPAYLHTERWEWEAMQCASLRMRHPEAPAHIRTYDAWMEWMDHEQALLDRVSD